MNLQLLQSELTRFEGCKLTVYRDTLGKLTCGIGHLITAEDNLNEGDTVTQQTVDNWFAKDVQYAISVAQRIFTNFVQFDDVRQRICVQLAYNLANKLLGFPKFVAAMNAMDWNTAGAELQNSLWYTQVGNRGVDTVYAIINGQYP